jgi:hypothetical protein
MLINDASITGSLIVNASASLQNISLGGNIIPDETNLRNLGSTDKYFKEIYVSTGSINFVDDGTIVAILNSDTLGALQNNTASANSRLAAIENFTSSLDATYTTDAELNASSSTLTSNINTKLNSSSFNSFTASVSATNAFTSSATARLNALETTSASVDTLNTAQNSRLGSLEQKTGSLATTGSNTFYGTQIISGTTWIAGDFIVQGSSSIQNITGSSINIGTNIINVNTANPAVRYAGLSVQDSGSANGVTGSLLWDSSCNRWIYSNPSTIGYSGGMLLSGPRTQTLGTEPTLTCNYIAKSGGGDHLYDSCIIDDGTTVCVNANLRGSSTISATSLRSNGVGTFGFNTTDNGEFQIYGTALDGMIMAGRGSSNDMVITNKNGSDVFRIPTGTIIANFIGSVCAPSFIGGTLGLSTTTADYAATITNVQDSSQGLLIRATDNDTSLYLLNLQSSPGATCQSWIDRFSVNKAGNANIGGNLIINGGTLLMNCDTTTSSDARINFYTKSSSTGDRVALYGYNLSATTTNCEISYQAFGYCTLNNQGYINFQTKNTSGWCNTMYLINGRVGIGVANPSVKLQIDGSLTLKSSSNQSVQIWNDGSVGANIGGNLEFRGTYRNSDNDSVIYGKIFGGKENSSDGNFAGYLSFSTYEYPNSLAERLRISSSGIACFSNTICSANLSTSGFLKAHNSMKTFVVEKNLDERLSNSNYFRMTSSSGGFQVIVYSFSQNVGVGWSGSQIFQAVSAPYWGGWVGSSANVSQIGGESGVISSAVIGNDGTITFRVNTGNNGTNTQGTIRSYIQVNAFNIDGVTLTAL